MTKPSETPKNSLNNLPSAQMNQQAEPPDAGVDSGDFSFIVVESSSEEISGTIENSITSNGLPPNAQSFGLADKSIDLQNVSLGFNSMVGVTYNEILQRLQNLLKENTELKEQLQQNNIVLKQHMDTMASWQEQVSEASQMHKQKFDEVKKQMCELKLENSSLKQAVEKKNKVQAENDSKLSNLEYTISVLEISLKEKTSEAQNMNQQLLELKSSLKNAEERAEEKELLEKEKEDLKIKHDLLYLEYRDAQSALFSMEAKVSEFVMVEEEREVQPVLDQSVGTEAKVMSEKIPFAQSMDLYEEQLLNALKHLTQQADSYKKIYNWLSDVMTQVSSSSLDSAGIKLSIDKLKRRLTEVDHNSSTYRDNLEKTKQQLSRLASNFQELHEDWLAIKNEKEEIARNNISYTEAQTQGFMEQIDKLKAQLLHAEDRAEEVEKALMKQKDTLLEQNNALAELHNKLEQKDSLVAKQQDAIQQTEKKLCSLEQNVEALSAQAEIYKTDFHEERESREMLATEKERIADELRALQRHYQQVLDQLEECQKQLQANQQQQTSNTPLSRNLLLESSSPQRETSPETPLEDEIPEPKEYICFKCNTVFRQLEPLQYHVETCLELNN